MEWFIAVLAVAALGIAAIVAAGGMGQMSDDPVRDTFAPTLPERPLTALDLQNLRLGVALRGYSMVQVDDLIDRLAREIEARDAQIAELRGAPVPAAPDPLPDPVPKARSVEDAEPEESAAAGASIYTAAGTTEVRP